MRSLARSIYVRFGRKKGWFVPNVAAKSTIETSLPRAVGARNAVTRQLWRRVLSCTVANCHWCTGSRQCIWSQPRRRRYPRQRISRLLHIGFTTRTFVIYADNHIILFRGWHGLFCLRQIFASPCCAAAAHRKVSKSVLSVLSVWHYSISRMARISAWRRLSSLSVACFRAPARCLHVFHA